MSVIMYLDYISNESNLMLWRIVIVTAYAIKAL